MKIKKNDIVKVITGKEKGKTGKVLKVIPSHGKVLIEGLNMYKKRVRPRRQTEKGQVISTARPLDISNVMIVCQSCHQTTRIGRRIEAAAKKRYCKKCNALL